MKRRLSIPKCEEAQRQYDAKIFGSMVKSPIWLSLDMVGAGELQDKSELGGPSSGYISLSDCPEHSMDAAGGPLLSPESSWLLTESSLLVSQSLGVTTSPARVH